MPNVEKERDPIEGPVPRIDTRLCLLLCITVLVIADLIEEEESTTIDETEYGASNHWKEKKAPGMCRNELISSLQILGEYQSLLTPPQAVTSACNQAAAKAMMFVSGISVSNAYFECINMKDMPMNTCEYYLFFISINYKVNNYEIPWRMVPKPI